MPAYIVTFELTNEFLRSKIVDTIKKGRSWAKLSASTYAISTSETPQQIYAKLNPLLSGSDTLYVFTMNRPYFGQGMKDINGWLTHCLTK